MIKKVLHRITVVWCLYGLLKIAMFIHPHLILLFVRIDPTFTSGHSDYTTIEQGMIMWFYIIFGVMTLFLACWGIHTFSNWFFNTK